MTTTETPMTSIVRTRSKVLPGKRVEFILPELQEGAVIDIEITQHLTTETEAAQPRKFRDVVEFLDSLPDRGSSPENRARIEREIEEIKNSWGE